MRESTPEFAAAIDRHICDEPPRLRYSGVERDWRDADGPGAEPEDIDDEGSEPAADQT